MLIVVHKIATWFLKRRLEQIEHFVRNPHLVQQSVFRQLIEKGKHAEWGKTYGYENSMKVDTFRERVPISSYEELFPWIDRMFRGESDILWPGKFTWFAKSSGTTNDKSKYIPVSEEALEGCHFRAGQDMLALYFDHKPTSKLFTGKALSIGGSIATNPHDPSLQFGDVSAVITETLPRFYELMRAPSKEVAMMENWEEKIVAMGKEVISEDITSIVGVPTWTLVLINHLFETLGMKERNLLQIWPNLELYLHGGVNFGPYREQFKKLIPSDEMTYLNCYNASEGFFAVQNDPNDSDLLLLLDYGIFYEFIPLDHMDEDHPKTHTLEDVEIGINYAMVISTNAGLWRYKIGDTIMFTSISPYKIRITGRTKHFINAFGEELMVDNAEKGITEACLATGAIVNNYTAGPIYLDGTKQGGHEWLIEFEKEPDNIEKFQQRLDEVLRSVNSDYDAKRQKNLALLPPKIHQLPRETFHRWMKKRGKLGGQHKVPRLANDRKYIEDILDMMAIR